MTNPSAESDAEENLLAACMVDSASEVPRCLAAGVGPMTFYKAENGRLFDEVLTLHAAGHPADVGTIWARLKATGQAEAAGGWDSIQRISGLQFTTAHTPFFIERVIEAHQRRLIVSHAAALMEVAKDPATDLREDVAPRIAKLAGLLTLRQSDRTWFQALDEAEALTRERMKPLAERNTGHAELSWGISDFDRHFQPIEPGELIVIGGYTSSGKSSLLRQVLWGAARSGHPALLETIEVRDAEEAVNLAGHITGVRSRAFLDLLHDAEKRELLAAFPAMRVPHFSVGHQDHNLAAIMGRARAFKAKHGLRLLGVDYLQILEDVKRLKHGERPDFAIGVVTSELKRFATAENCAVFLLSGFNRQYASDGNREPVLSDLDGSASIEKDASRVLLLDMPKSYRLNGAKHDQDLTASAKDQPSFYVKCIQAKGRNQGTAMVGLYFRRETKTFIPIAK